MKRIDLDKQISDQAVHINMSPLIDVVFLLLIFFVVTTVFVEETGVDVQKPKAASARDLKKKSILIAITSSGNIMYDNHQITLNTVRGIIAQQLRKENIPVILVSDKKASTGRLINVIDECKLAGAKQVSIATKRE